jgi:hypothetical protein
MRSEVVEVPKDIWLGGEQYNTARNPLHCAYVSCGSKYYAVGTLALKFNGFSKLKQLKIDLAPIKILAAVWIAIEHFQLPGSYELELIYCLPPGEIKQSKNFDKTLSKALSRFDTPSGVKEVKLTSSMCFPEGFGIFTKHSHERPTIVREHCVSTLVMGFRNLSILAATGGNIDLSKSSDLGFITAVRDVLKMVDGYQESELASAMSEYRISGDEKALERILLATPVKERKQELTALKKAIDVSMSRYLSLVQSWVEEYLPQRTQEILVCGGTGDCLNPQLAEWLRTKVPPIGGNKGGYGVFFHCGFNPPEAIAGLGYGNRFADIYYLSHYYLVKA